MQSSAASAMQRAAHFLSLLCVVWRTSTAETGLRIPFSSQGSSAEADSIHRALFGSQEARTSVDIAVPQEQRLFGREPRGDTVTRPNGVESQQLRSYLDAFKFTHYNPAESTVPLEESDASDAKAASNISMSSPSRHVSSSPVRRDVHAEPRCPFDAEKWALHVDSSLSYAVMFDRKSAVSCTECLESCMENQGGTWSCRSVVYDSNWKICDMFAVTAATAPFTLVAYDGRDYLEYLAAIPPSDDELTNANVLTTQEQAIPSKRHKLSCESSSVEKPPSVRPEKSGGATHGAVSTADQLKAAESGTMRREKALEKEERKLRKLTRSPVQATTSPGPTSAQVAMFDEVNRIAMLPETSTNAAASSMNKRLEGKFSVIHANNSVLLSKNHDRIKPGEVGNSKIKGGRRKQATMSKVEETRELSDDLVPEKKSLSAEIAEWEEMLRKREEEKVIRRKPARATSVTPESLTTTGTPEGLSADIARLKIEAYQQRKAAEATAFAVHPPRRRIRLEGSRLVGDALDESELRRNEGVTGSQSKAVAKHDNRSGDEREQKEPEQPAGEAAKSAGQPKRRRTKKQRKTTATSPAATTVEARATTTSPSSAAATTTTATTATASDPEHLRDEIRIALSREIKKYITKELKEKGFRAHGTRVHKSDGHEQIEVPVSEPAGSDEGISERTASASSSTCEDDERVVMISFPSSTRKPYTAAVETLRARNHRHCLEECERSPDCSSAVFSELLCEMSATRARHSVADIRPAVNQSYFEKACVDKAAVKGRSTHLSGVANYILAGFVEQVEDASGIEQCISACYGALKHYGFQCMSAMWYPMDQKQNCLLNSETKRTQEKMFIPEDTGHMMIYFEHPDALFMRRLHDETSFDEAKAPQLWTAWSSCHTSTERVRYQHCDDHVDIRKCPKEVARCGDMSSAQKASVADGWSTASANVHMSQ